MSTLAACCETGVQLWSVSGEKKGVPLELPTGGGAVTGMLWGKSGSQPICVTTKGGAVGIYSNTGELDQSLKSVSVMHPR
jgi:hypothetical protein